MPKKKTTVAINLKDENNKRGEIRKVISLVSELKRSSRIEVAPVMFGLPSNPVYEKYYGDEDISKGNRAIIEFKDIEDSQYQMVVEYIGTNGGKVLDRRAKTDKNTMILIDTSDMR